MVYLSHVILHAEDECAERFANQFVPRFAWASSLVSEFYSEEIYRQREIRAPSWGLWIVCTDSVDALPAMKSAWECRWPVDLGAYLDADSDLSKRRYMLETMHEACLWVAAQKSWPLGVFGDAYRSVVDRGFDFSGFVGRSYPSPDKRFTVRIHCDYGIEWIYYFAVLCRYRSKKEIAKIPLGKLRPAVGRVADGVAGGRWRGGNQFVLSSRSHNDWVVDFSSHMD